MDMEHITVCPGCSGCEETEEFYELEAMMSERPDGNDGPPAHCLHEWNPRLKGKTYTAVKHRRTADSIGSILARARAA